MHTLSACTHTLTVFTHTHPVCTHERHTPLAHTHTRSTHTVYTNTHAHCLHTRARTGDPLTCVGHEVDEKVEQRDHLCGVERKKGDDQLPLRVEHTSQATDGEYVVCNCQPKGEALYCQKGLWKDDAAAAAAETARRSHSVAAEEWDEFVDRCVEVGRRHSQANCVCVCIVPQARCLPCSDTLSPALQQAAACAEHHHHPLERAHCNRRMSANWSPPPFAPPPGRSLPPSLPPSTPLTPPHHWAACVQRVGVVVHLLVNLLLTLLGGSHVGDVGVEKVHLMHVCKRVSEGQVGVSHTG